MIEQKPQQAVFLSNFLLIVSNKFTYLCHISSYKHIMITKLLVELLLLFVFRTFKYRMMMSQNVTILIKYPHHPSH